MKTHTEKKYESFEDFMRAYFQKFYSGEPSKKREDPEEQGEELAEIVTKDLKKHLESTLREVV